MKPVLRVNGFSLSRLLIYVACLQVKGLINVFLMALELVLYVFYVSTLKKKLRIELKIRSCIMLKLFRERLTGNSPEEL